MDPNDDPRAPTTAPDPAAEPRTLLRLRALAHDMRTPLTVISLNAELLQEGARARGDTDQLRKLEAVLAAAERLRELTRAMSETLRGDD